MGYKKKMSARALRKLNKLKRAKGLAIRGERASSTVDQVPKVKEPPREPTEEELLQRELDLEKRKLKRKLRLDTVDFVGSLESRTLRVRPEPPPVPVKQMKSELLSGDGSYQGYSDTLRANRTDGEAGTQGDGEGYEIGISERVPYQPGDAVENDQRQETDGIPRKKKPGRPRKVKDPLDPGQPKRGRPRGPYQKKKDGPQVAKPKKNKILKPSQACRIINRVYHYLEREYDFIKTYTENKCDLSPLGNILKRTADATGFPEKTVTNILQAEELRRKKLREEADLQYKALLRAERRAQRELERNTTKRRKKTKKEFKKSSSSEVTSVNVNNEASSEITLAVNSEPVLETLKVEVYDEGYGDARPLAEETSAQQSTEPAMVIKITALTSDSQGSSFDVKEEPVDVDLLESDSPAHKPPLSPAELEPDPANGPTQPTQNGSQEYQQHSPKLDTIDPVQLELQETSFAVQHLQTLLAKEEDPLS